MFAISVFFMAKRDAFETTIKNGITASMNSYDGQSNESPIDFLQAHVIYLALVTHLRLLFLKILNYI